MMACLLPVSCKTYNINFSVEVGLDEAGVKNDISVFPNPANDRIYLKGIENADIRFFNITGQMVLAADGMTAHSIDVSSLEAGNFMKISPIMYPRSNTSPSPVV